MTDQSSRPHASMVDDPGTAPTFRRNSTRVPRSKPLVVADLTDDAASTETLHDEDGTATETIPSDDPVVVAPAGRPLGLVVATAVLSVLLVVALVLGGLFWSSANQKSAVDTARGQALTAARQYALAIGGYDYRHLDQDFATVLADSTPTFQQNYKKSSDLLKTVLVKYHATSKATVIAAGVASATTSKVVALVFLNQTVTNTTQTKGSSTTPSRVEMTLVHMHGRWLINAVTLY